MLSNTVLSGQAGQLHKNMVYVWDGVMMYISHEHVNGMHAHFPALLQIGLGAKFAVQLQHQQRHYHDVVVMAPNVSHSTDSEGQAYLVVLIEPDHALYCYLHPLLNDQPLCSLPATGLQAFKPQFARLVAGHLTIDEARQLLLHILCSLCSQPLQALPWDSRILQACDYMTRLVPQHMPTVMQVAAQVALSESRLMHLFSEQLGISMRQYLLWLRIRHALKLWVAGYALIDIALESGFSDQAHFTRTLRRMIDFAPSVLKANTVFISNASE